MMMISLFPVRDVPRCQLGAKFPVHLRRLHSLHLLNTARPSKPEGAGTNANFGARARPERARLGMAWARLGLAFAVPFPWLSPPYPQRPPRTPLSALTFPAPRVHPAPRSLPFSFPFLVFCKASCRSTATPPGAVCGWHGRRRCPGARAALVSRSALSRCLLTAWLILLPGSCCLCLIGRTPR